jgi:predicted XRE-type DNA-binding protein
MMRHLRTSPDAETTGFGPTAAQSTTVVRVEPHLHEHSRAKIELAARVNGVLNSRGLNQIEAGRVLGMSQPKVSALRNYKLHGISLERLLAALADLGQDVEIVVSSSDRTSRTPVPA